MADQSQLDKTNRARVWMRRFIVGLVAIALGWLVLANLFPLTPIGKLVNAREWSEARRDERRASGGAKDANR